MLELHAIAGPAFGHSHHFSGELLQVGSAAAEPGWSIGSDAWLSPTHFVLRRTDAGIVLQTGQSGKTLVNGKPVDDSIALNPGDTISAGTSVFTVFVVGSANADPAEGGKGGTKADAEGAVSSPYRRVDGAKKAAHLLREQAGGRTLFAIIDAARSPLVRPLLDKAGSPFECLFTLDDMPADVKAYAPYVAELRPQSRLLELLTHHGWNEHWCSYAVSASSLEQMRVHLKKFLVVKLDDDREVFFRFFDPRVMRVFIPACAQEEAERFFGDITAFFCSDAEGACMEFALDGANAGGRRLATRLHPL